MRFAAIGLLAGILCAGCALQPGDPGDEPTAVPAATGAIQFAGGETSGRHKSSASTGSPEPGSTPDYNPQPAPWGSPLAQGQSGSSGSGDSTKPPPRLGSGGADDPVPVPTDTTDELEKTPGAGHSDPAEERPAAGTDRVGEVGAVSQAR
jgi:hypothetical protein